MKCEESRGGEVMRFINGEPKWEEANYPEHGITSLATAKMHPELPNIEIVGYNGILRGDYVTYNGETWRVVMVSRLGDFGLSKTYNLPYTIRVRPSDVTKVGE